MTAEPAGPYETFRLGDRVAAIVPLDDLTDLDERLAVAAYLADKEGMRARGTAVKTEEDLIAMLDAYEAEHSCA